jgi:hypothetical protein
VAVLNRPRLAGFEVIGDSQTRVLQARAGTGSWANRKLSHGEISSRNQNDQDSFSGLSLNGMERLKIFINLSVGQRMSKWLW